MFFNKKMLFFILHYIQKKLCFKEFDEKSRNILKVWKLRNKGNL